MNTQEAINKAREWKEEGSCSPTALVAIALLDAVDSGRAQGLEEAARQCDLSAKQYNREANGGDNSGTSDWKEQAAEMLAEDIRALAQSQPAAELKRGECPLDENELWDLLDSVGDALSRRAAPHAWESIARTAGFEFIAKRREKLVALPSQPAGKDQP